MGRDRSATLVARLRAHRKIPAGIPVEIKSLTGMPDGKRITWIARHAVTKEPLGVGSRHPIELMVKPGEWTFTVEGGVTIVAPASQEGP